MKTDQSRHAFSLIELLVTVSIISMLAVVSVPSLRGTLDGVNLNSAANLIVAEFSLARQTAMSRNLTVEVRLYLDTETPENTWRILAPVITSAVSGNSSDEWIGPGTSLPGNVVIDSGMQYSTLLTVNSTGNESSAAPRLMRSKKYISFRFQPDGSTDLASDQPWCLTLKNKNSTPGASNTPAANFVAIVIDPRSGHAQTYQP